MNKIENEKKQVGFAALQLLFFGVVGGTLLLMLGVALLFLHFSTGLPKIITVADYHPLGVTRVFAAPGGAAHSGTYQNRYRHGPLGCQ